MSTFATITLEVTVELDRDLGINTPSAYEPPYEYLAVRGVEASAIELQGDPAALALIEHGGIQELDPDGLLISELGAALLALDPEQDSPTAPAADEKG